MRLLSKGLNRINDWTTLLGFPILLQGEAHAWWEGNKVKRPSGHFEVAFLGPYRGPSGRTEAMTPVTERQPSGSTEVRRVAVKVYPVSGKLQGEREDEQAQPLAPVKGENFTLETRGRPRPSTISQHSDQDVPLSHHRYYTARNAAFTPLDRSYAQ